MTTLEKLDALEAGLEALRTKFMPVASAETLRREMDGCELTLADAALVLEYPVATVEDWLTGGAPVPRLAVTTLRLYRRMSLAEKRRLLKTAIGSDSLLAPLLDLRPEAVAEVAGEAARESAAVPGLPVPVAAFAPVPAPPVAVAAQREPLIPEPERASTPPPQPAPLPTPAGGPAASAVARIFGTSPQKGSVHPFSRIEDL